MHKAKQLPLQKGTRFEQIFHKDHRDCTCEMPMVSKKWNDALGTFVVIRLCCMAKAVGELLGLDLYQVHEFDPKWVWDCKELHEAEDPQTGTVTMVERGRPPAWLLKRFQEKGVEVRNLE